MADYVKVLIPLKFREELTYTLPEGMEVTEGDWVKVSVGRRECVGLVSGTGAQRPDVAVGVMKCIGEKISLPQVSPRQLEFWKRLAAYYMCPMSDILRAACPDYLQKQAQVRNPRRSAAKEKQCSPLPRLSPAQKKAFEGIRAAFSENKTALLHGVTGSGKTEIYMHAATETLQKGRSVLLMVPEIAMSRQLQGRFEKVFGNNLLVFHSRQSAAQRKKVYDRLGENHEAAVILGTRSAIFLPFSNLGLIVVDEEHDPSYKQDEPAPRYNGRDAAMILASLQKADVLLGSATPSLESLYNALSGKYRKIDLREKYCKGAAEPEVIIIDTRRSRRNKDMDGAFSKHLLHEIEKTVRGGTQVMIFRSRRAYSTMVQCSACGEIPSCPKCGVPLTYHKFNETLECHYCGYHCKFRNLCTKCGEEGTLESVGAGTEKLEEELSAHFPTYRIERFDADTTRSKLAEEEILKEFAEGKIDILVGTQMLTKGFDFEKLALVAVIAADSILAIQDFRADERALQLLRQLRGRAGRRELRGRMFIQTSQPEHPVFQRLVGERQEWWTGIDSIGDAVGVSGGTGTGDEASVCVSKAGTAVETGSIGLENVLAERKAFGFPPFVRLIKLTVADRNEGELWHVGREIVEILGKSGANDFSGPITPAIGKIGGYFVSEFWIKLPRMSARANAEIKRQMAIRLDAMILRFKRKPVLTIDVDPL